MNATIKRALLALSLLVAPAAYGYTSLSPAGCPCGDRCACEDCRCGDACEAAHCAHHDGCAHGAGGACPTH